MLCRNWKDICWSKVTPVFLGSISSQNTYIYSAEGHGQWRALSINSFVLSLVSFSLLYIIEKSISLIHLCIRTSAPACSCAVGLKARYNWYNIIDHQKLLLIWEIRLEPFQYLRNFKTALISVSIAVHNQMLQTHFWLAVSRSMSFYTFRQITGNTLLLLTMKRIHWAQHQFCYSTGINFLIITCSLNILIIFISVRSQNLISIWCMKQI